MLRRRFSMAQLVSFSRVFVTFRRLRRGRLLAPWRSLWTTSSCPSRTTDFVFVSDHHQNLLVRSALIIRSQGFWGIHLPFSDHVLVSQRWKNAILDVESDPYANIASDHYPISFKLKIRFQDSSHNSFKRKNMI